jgi:hypothetical protein
MTPNAPAHSLTAKRRFTSCAAWKKGENCLRKILRKTQFALNDGELPGTGRMIPSFEARAD